LKGGRSGFGARPAAQARMNNQRMNNQRMNNQWNAALVLAQ
jgi:hypothetical protein